MPAILTLAQVKEITHAYDSFTTVEDSDLPDYYKEIFPKKCKCGGEIIMTCSNDSKSKYTQLQCCNPDCWVKMAHKFSYFAQALGFKGFGTAGALQLYNSVCNQFKYPTFLSVFEVPYTDIATVAGEAYANNFMLMKQELHDNGFQLKDAIAALGIPDLGKASAIFHAVKSIDVLVAYVVNKKTDELCDIVGINAPIARYALKMASIDIVTLVTDVMPHILNTPKSEVFVAITGSVTVGGKSMTRAEFIWLCESLKDAKGNQAFKLVETKAESKLEYVIADSPSDSSKYKIGRKLGIIITANEFYVMLKSQLEGSDADGPE